MKKLILNLDELRVDSFDTSSTHQTFRGTVEGADNDSDIDSWDICESDICESDHPQLGTNWECAGGGGNWSNYYSCVGTCARSCNGTCYDPTCAATCQGPTCDPIIICIPIG